MEPAIQMIAYGIKCDHCDYKDETVHVDDYEQWVNKPCPDCGENLLTESDYDAVKQMQALAATLNGIFPAQPASSQKHKISVDLDGTGQVAIKEGENE